MYVTIYHTGISFYSNPDQNVVCLYAETDDACVDVAFMECASPRQAFKTAQKLQREFEGTRFDSIRFNAADGSLVLTDDDNISTIIAVDRDLLTDAH